MRCSIIFGLGPSGLFLGRELAKNGTKVIGIGRKDDIGLFSKFVEGYIAESGAEVLKILDQILLQTNDIPKGYICSDQYITLLLNECPEVFEKIEIFGLNKAGLELVNNKSQLTDYCKKLGISIPETYNYKDILENKKVNYPLIFKVNNKEIKSARNPIGKIKIVNNQKELEQLKLEINRSAISSDEIIVQTYILGDNQCQFSFGGYFNSGKQLAGIIVNQIRQYPQGVSSFVIETENHLIKQNIRENVTKFAESLKYTGFLEVEFKINKNKVFLMDINPRPWGWVSILGKKYINFHEILLNNNAKLIKSKELLAWKSPIRDVIGLIKNPLNVKSFKNRSKFLKKNFAYDIYDKRDIGPTFALLKVGLIKIFKK